MTSIFSRVDLDGLRAAWWAIRAARQARRRLETEGFESTIGVTPPPRLSDEAEGAVIAVLSRRPETCLVRAVVLQAWHAAHGRRRDLIIGVTRPADGFRAHAWLEGDPPSASEGFRELLRRAAPS